MLNNIVELLNYLVILSVATERLVELLKPVTLKYRINVDYKVVAIICGTGLAYYTTVPILPNIINIQLVPLFAGLLASGGSGIWHDALNIIKNFSTSLKV